MPLGCTFGLLYSNGTWCILCLLLSSSRLDQEYMVGLRDVTGWGAISSACNIMAFQSVSILTATSKHHNDMAEINLKVTSN